MIYIRKKLKKGFTLIELIAVIAILAILGMILVPKIAGYKSKASKSNYQASAKTILNAVKAYNADVPQESDAIDIIDSVSSAADKINSGLSTPILATDTSDSNSSYTKLSSLSVGQLANVASGDFALDSDGNVTVPGTGTIE